MGQDTRRRCGLACTGAFSRVSFLLASTAELLLNCGVPNEKGTDSWRTLSPGGGADELGLSALNGAFRSAACFSPTFKHGKYAQARTASDKVAYQIGKSRFRFGLS
jgi:hypothetical protein